MITLFVGDTDIGMTLEGDVMISKDGDIALVEGWEWLYREVNKRVRTTNPEWRGHATIGADMGEYHGAPNTEATAKLIRQSIKRALAIDNIGYPGRFDVRVVPTSVDTILIMIYLNVAGARVELEKLIYDYSGGVVQVLEASPEVKRRTMPDNVKRTDYTANTSKTTNNKYLDVIKYQR